MCDNSKNLIPARQMSGRRSKPSIDLLVDNQRVLYEFIEPVKVSRKYIIKPFTDRVSMSNHLQKLPLKVRLKPGPKSRRLDSPTKAEGENTFPKVVEPKQRISLPIVNGSKEVNESAMVHDEFQYAKKINTLDTFVDGQAKEDDDLPLSKVFPDFRPRPSPSETLRRLVLPPKKKIKFVDISEMLGMVAKPPVSEEKVRPKTDVLSLPKIPRKSRENGAAETPARVRSKSPDRSPLPARTETTPRRCVRRTCTNVAIEDSRWDWEFCSPDCAVVHSKYVLNEWLFQRREPPSLLI